MSDQDTTEIINKHSFKDKETAKKIDSNGLIIKDTIDNPQDNGCEEMLKEKLCILIKSKTSNINRDKIESFNKTPDKNHLNDFSIISDEQNINLVLNRNIKKKVKFNDELGNELIEYIDFISRKEFHVQLDEEFKSIKGYNCYCTIF